MATALGRFRPVWLLASRYGMPRSLVSARLSDIVGLSNVTLRDEPLTIRMTGCPNGCARPYNADIAFVGRNLNKYMVYVGGNPEGTRLRRRRVLLR